MRKSILLIMLALAMVFALPISADEGEENSDDAKTAQVLYSVSARITYALPVGEDIIMYVKYGDRIIQPEHPDMKGYTFIGWFTDEGVEWDFDEPATRHMTLTARYRKDSGTLTEYEVRFRANGAETFTKVSEGYKVREPAPPEKEGYTFIGWYRFDQKWNFSDPVYENMTLEAHFEPLETDESKISEIKITVDDGIRYIIRVIKGDKLDEPVHKDKSGYNFLGWYTADGRKWNFDDPVEEDMTLEARYRRIPSPDPTPDDSSSESGKSGMSPTGSGQAVIIAASMIVGAGIALFIVEKKKRKED